MSTIFTPPAEDDDLVIAPAPEVPDAPATTTVAAATVAAVEQPEPEPAAAEQPEPEPATPAVAEVEKSDQEENIVAEVFELPTTLYLGKETTVTDSVWDFGNSTVLCIDPVEDKMVANKRYIDERINGSVKVDELTKSLEEVIADLKSEVARAKKSEADLKAKVDLLCQYLFKTTKPNKLATR
uniref:Uncharacterized protein n=1 Tax=viral metagenome TaxID=1070528 RepID=A0A6C0I4B4_9ZZZZ